jgi:heme oxygenase
MTDPPRAVAVKAGLGAAGRRRGLAMMGRSLTIAGPLCAMPVLLAERLRQATRDLHREVERTGPMPALLRGQLPRADYLRLLRNLHALYQALEAGLDGHAADPRLAPLWWPDLARTGALAADLQALHGPGWAQALPLCAATQAYVQHLRQLADARPAQLAAHAYVRYLGDLHGGQVLARRVAQGLQLPPGPGLAFYDLGPPAQVQAAIRRFRQGLDTVAPDEAAAQALVDEALDGFARHRALFAELAAGAGAHDGASSPLKARISA